MPDFRDDTLTQHSATTPLSTSFAQAHKRLSIIIARIVIMVAILALIGWIFDIAFLKSIIPGLATMKVNTALAFILSGVALHCLSQAPAPTKRASTMAQVSALAATLFGLLTLAEYLLGWNLGIDQLLIRDTLTDPANFPGRMSAATALCLVLTGTALWLLTQKRYLLAHIVTTILGFMALLALIGYVYGLDSLYDIFLYSSMALHTAVSFAALSVGILFVYPHQGMMPVIVNENISGMMIRRLMPAAISLPFVLGALVLLGERVERYDFSFGTALLVLAMTVIFCLLIGFSAHSIYEVDVKRQQAQAALREAEQKYRTIFENAVEGIYQSLPSGQIITANPALARMLGYSSSQALITALEYGEQQLFADPGSYQAFRQMLDTYKIVREFEVQLVCQNGSKIWASVNRHEVCDDNGRLLYYEGTMSDISERKHLIAENESLTAQFYQAQKMESIGRLAGGIAHDFNNLLVPIVGYAELGEMGTRPSQKLHTYFTHIGEAAKRSATLVRQILAFSRQQILQVRVLDLNQIIAEFQPMFQSLLGEDVILQTHLAPKLQTIEADQSQIEQILMNLGVNARDAMPNGGNLIIETANVELDETYTAKYSDIEPGSYVMLAVSDTGHGMDETTQASIFEPFFTTKSRDKGTGLGLSTVFGIVKQHNGNIWVYSEPDRGTTFKIYLPVTETAVATSQPITPQTNLLQGTESILVVEDEAGVRQLVCETLEANGYSVLESGDPEEALTFMETHGDQIDLLLTDVIMPKMNGPELYKQLLQTRPQLKVLYMSGYTDNVMVLHNKLNDGILLLQKPFPIRLLLQRVREALGEGETAV